MDWKEALEIVVNRTKHDRYRYLCSDESSDHEIWRARMIAQATGNPILSSHAYPPAIIQAKNAVTAIARFVGSGMHFVGTAEMERRLSICQVCEHYDASRGRCRLCGCVAKWKVRLQSEHCPDNPPRW